MFSTVFSRHQTSLLAQVLDEIRSFVSQQTGEARVRIPKRLLDRLIRAAFRVSPEFGSDVERQVGMFRELDGEAPWLFRSEIGPSVLAGFIKPMKSVGAPTLEYLFYSRLDVRKEVSGIDSNSVPVLAQKRSHGLQPDVVVAVFPENLKFGQYEPVLSDPVFYLVDGFEKRTRRSSIPTLVRGTTGASFPHLKQAFRSRWKRRTTIHQLSAHWLWLHEYMHRIGHLPYFRYPKLKRRGDCAGLEETRADCLAIQHARSLGSPFGLVLSEFILFERLIRYPVECAGRQSPFDYDAIGSLTLQGFLRESGCVSFANDRMAVSSDWPVFIDAFSRAVDELERGIKARLPRDVDPAPSERNAVREPIREFVMKYLSDCVSDDVLKFLSSASDTPIGQLPPFPEF